MRILRFQFWTSAKQQAKILNPTNSGFKKNHIDSSILQWFYSYL